MRRVSFGIMGFAAVFEPLCKAMKNNDSCRFRKTLMLFLTRQSLSAKNRDRESLTTWNLKHETEDVLRTRRELLEKNTASEIFSDPAAINTLLHEIELWDVVDSIMDGHEPAILEENAS